MWFQSEQPLYFEQYYTVTKDVRVRTLVIWVWAAFTDNVAPARDKPGTSRKISCSINIWFSCSIRSFHWCWNCNCSRESRCSSHILRTYWNCITWFWYSQGRTTRSILYMVKLPPEKEFPVSEPPQYSCQLPLLVELDIPIYVPQVLLLFIWILAYVVGFTVKLLNVPTEVICVCAAFTDNVPDALVNPVPVVRKVKPSTHAFVDAWVASVGVGMVTAPETFRYESVPTLVIWACVAFSYAGHREVFSMACVRSHFYPLNKE